jgi:branched-chain amino acid transport system substrate-binding protein
VGRFDITSKEDEMRRDRLVSVAVVTAIVLASFLFSGVCARDALAQTKTLKIGLVASMTGPLAPAFRSAITAAKPAADFLNQRGGLTIKGQKYRIEILTADDQSSPPGAVAAANKLLQQDVKFIIPPVFPIFNMALGPVCEQAKILRMEPNSLEPSMYAPPNHYSFVAEFTGINPHYFYERLMQLYPHLKRIAIVRPDDAGMKFTVDATIKEIRSRGMEVVIEENYKIGTEDFYPILTKVLARKPDAIECIGSTIPWAKSIIEQSREMGFTGPVTALTAFGAMDVLIKVLNPKHAYDVCAANPDVTSPKMLPIVKEFGKVIERDIKEPYSFDHLLTLRAAWVLVQGIEAAQSLDTDKVIEALENMSSVETPYGPARFGGEELVGKKRLLIGDIPFSRITKGGRIEFEFLKVKQ